MTKGINYIGVSVSFFCHDGKGNYLFNKRSKNCRDEHGRWDPGGGGVEFGERVEDVLKKEIKEEYCADILEKEFLGFRDVHRTLDGQPTHWVTLDYKILVDRAQVRNGEPHKFEELGWFRLDALPEPMHSQYGLALEQYGDRL
ncbi:MAG: NUDIX domain-containing protein [Microgenomates group bacterium]